MPRVVKEMTAHGHRARMRSRILSNGAEALADYEILKVLLYLSIPRRDTKPKAKALLKSFGSLRGVCLADTAALRACGLGPTTIETLRWAEYVAETLSGCEKRTHILLGGWDHLCTYLRKSFALPDGHSRRFLFLDSKNRLLSDEAWPQSEGAGGVFRHALAVQAVAYIGVERPNPYNRRAIQGIASFARGIQRQGESLSIALYDYVILRDPDTILSLRHEGLL